MGCWDKILKGSPEIVSYLKSKTGIDYNPNTKEGREAYLKAAKELQEHSVNTINDIYADLGIEGYKKAEKVSSETDLLGTAKDLVNSDVVKGFSAEPLKDAANNNPEEFKTFLSEIAEQAQDENSVKETINTYGKELVDVATKLFPKTEETKVSSTPSTEKNEVAEIEKRRKEDIDRLNNIQKISTEAIGKPDFEKAEFDDLRNKINAQYDAELEKLKSEQVGEVSGVSPSSKGNEDVKVDNASFKEYQKLNPKGIDLNKVADDLLGHLKDGDNVEFFAEKKRVGKWDAKRKMIRDENGNMWGTAAILNDKDGYVKSTPSPTVEQGKMDYEMSSSEYEAERQSSVPVFNKARNIANTILSWSGTKGLYEKYLNSIGVKDKDGVYDDTSIKDIDGYMKFLLKEKADFFTKEDYDTYMKYKDFMDRGILPDWKNHETKVSIALSEGKKVPNEILKEYPELNPPTVEQVKEDKNLKKVVDSVEEDNDYNLYKVLSKRRFAKELKFDGVPTEGAERIKYLKYRNEYLDKVLEKLEFEEHAAKSEQWHDLYERMEDEYDANAAEIKNDAKSSEQKIVDDILKSSTVEQVNKTENKKSEKDNSVVNEGKEENVFDTDALVAKRTLIGEYSGAKELAAGQLSNLIRAVNGGQEITNIEVGKEGKIKDSERLGGKWTTMVEYGNRRSASVSFENKADAESFANKIKSEYDALKKGKPKEEAPIENKTKEEGKKIGKFEAKAREIVAKKKDIAVPQWLINTDPTIKKQGLDAASLNKALDDAIIAVGKALDRGVELIDAIKEGADNLIKDYRKGLGLSDIAKLKPELEKQLRDGFDNHYRENVLGEEKTKQNAENEPPKPPIEETETSNEGEGKRRFTQQELNNPEILPEAKAEIAKNINYVIQTNALSVAEAKRILDSIGVDEAYDLVVNNKDLKPAVRVIMGEVLILKYNDLASKATNEVDKDYYHDKTIWIANFVAEELGTKPGQMIQALSLFQRLSPEAQLRSATKEVKEQAKKKKAKRKKDVDAVADKFKKVNEETVDKIIGSEKVKEKVKRTETFTIKKAKDKIAQAKIRRDNIIKKYKGEKGKTLYSAPTGLTSEGIEFVGNLAKTYLDEGIANVELIVAKVIQHLKDASNKPINDEVEKNVNDIVNERFAAYADKRIAANLKGIEKTVGEIIRKHYTVDDGTKKTLTEKFVTDAGLERNDAAQLAKEIETEFDRIATRKKNEILQQEKTRFDRIQKGMQGSKKVEPKTLHDAMIRYSNLGAFTNESLSEMIAQKLGLGSLSVEEGAKIIELSKKIAKAPEGSPKNEATEDLLRYRAQLKGTTFGEMGQAIWYANILSGYGTHIKNIVSTFYNTMSFAATELARDPKSLPVLMLGGAKGVRRGLTEAWHTITTGRSPIHISKIETPQTLERVRFTGGLLNPYNYLKFVGRLMVAEDVLQFQALKEMRATQLAYREAKKLGFSNPFSKQTWRIIDDKLLNTKERYAEVLEQIKEEGVTGVEARRRIYELMEATRPIQMTEDSYGFAAKGTFNYEPSGTLGALTTAISTVLDLSVGGVKPLRFVVPFTRILTNVANNMLDFSPVGFIRAARGVRGFESFEGTKFKDAYYVMSKEERQQTIARASLGIGLTLALYAMTKIKGDDDEPLIEITGSGTGDFRKDIQLKQSGWQPYSIKVGDKYYSYALTPLLLNLGWIGNRNDREKYDSKFNEETELKRLMMSVYQSGQMLSDMTWVGSSADVLKSFASLRPSEIGKGLESTLKNSAKGFIIPNAYSQLAQKYEQINNIPQKEVNGLFDELIQDIPIARNRLNDRINALGDTITRDRDLLVSKETQDPIWKFLLDKKGWVAPVNKNSLIISESKTKEERKATEDEYYEFSKLRGSKIKESLKNIMENGALVMVDEEGELEVTTQEDLATDTKLANDLTTFELRKLLKSIATKATKEAKKELFSDKSEVDE